jgi:ion channel-forming bestrophin family protein
MIVRERPKFWEIFYLSLVIPRILPQLAAVLTVSLLVVVASRHGWMEIPKVPTVGLTVIGAALSIFAAFRNSAGYERWWEARKISGLIVVELRICRVRRIATSRKRPVTICLVASRFVALHSCK